VIDDCDNTTSVDYTITIEDTTPPTVSEPTDVTIEAWQGNQLVGGPGSNATTATQFLMDAVFVGDALADEPEDVKTAALKDIGGLLRQYETADGVKMAGKAWFTTARA